MAVGTSYRVKPGRMLREGWQARSERLRGFSWTGRHGVLLVALLGALIRLWQIGSLGFNSDEAVYAGQAASIAGKADYLPYFPIFRAHPLLYQSLLSVIYRVSVSDVAGRALTVVFGVATLVVVYALGRLLYGPRAGIVAMLLLAVMPYHVIVTRQVLLDGPMVFFATLALWLLVKYCVGQGAVWLVAAAAVMGLAVLTKETAVVLVAGVYMFFMLTHVVKVRASLVAWSLAAMAAVAWRFPWPSRSRERPHRGSSYLAWQLFRRQNHPFDFYLTTVPFAIGVAVVACAVGGLVVDRRDLDWREWLLCTWAIAPIVFFTLTPLKGFQYLLPVAPVAPSWPPGRSPPAACGTGVAACPGRPAWHGAGRASLVAVVLSLLLPTLEQRAALHQPAVPGGFGRPARRAGGGHLDRGEPPGGRDAAHPRAVDGQRRPVLRPPPGVRPLGQPQPAQPQPVLRGRSTTPTWQLRNGSIQYACGTPSRGTLTVVLRRSLLAYVAKYHGVRHPHPDRHAARGRTAGPTTSRSSGSSRCSHEATSSPCAVALAALVLLAPSASAATARTRRRGRRSSTW